MIETLTEPKLSAPQRRTMLLKRGLRKSAVDELEVLDGKGKEKSVVQEFPFSDTEIDDWVDTIIPKVEKVSQQLAQKIRPFVDEVTQMLEKLELFGIPARQSIIFHPLALVFNSRIADGVCFEVVRPGKRADVLAAGGRYVSAHDRSQVRPNERTIDTIGFSANFTLQIKERTSRVAQSSFRYPSRGLLHPS